MMKGAHVSIIREHLGDAVAQAIGDQDFRLSLQKFGEAMKLKEESAARTARRWESRDGPSGPAEIALVYMIQGLTAAGAGVPEFITDREQQITMRLHWPRFIAFGPRNAAGITWIDNPAQFGREHEAKIQAFAFRNIPA